FPPPDRLVVVSGRWRATTGEPRILVPDRITPLFDVRFRFTGPRGHSTTEAYAGVTIGQEETALSLQFKILDRPSQLVRASAMSKADSLLFPQSRVELTYMNCHDARFDRVVFAGDSISPALVPGEIARFAGGPCREWAIFDVSRFSDARPDGETALFGGSATSTDPPVQ